ncbi:hypothetical protein VP1G_03331 [Cytospora mali]|uniref:Uncharacterized protein n=1 Tax=Cytospora mali TaxID=578113 RepID=A0A194UW63_CYTMA|nr:hypothetical protein VP1G_03331 [Valsa mali var. pyri (nom. inval.)]
MDSFSNNSTFSKVSSFSRGQDRMIGMDHSNEGYYSSNTNNTFSTSGRRKQRSNTESSTFSLGNNFFSTYAPEKSRKGSASSSTSSSYNSSSSHDKFGGQNIEGRPFGTNAGLSVSSELDPSQQTLLREIGAALTLGYGGGGDERESWLDHVVWLQL